MSLCNCPAPTALTTVPSADCPFDLGQIQKIGFQRAGFTFDSGAVSPTSPSVFADWTALKTATDSTKVVFTPLIGGDPVVVAGEAISEGGGDNSTMNGIEIITGVNPSKFSAMYRSMTPEQESAIKKLMCEPNLVVYFITDNQKIIVKKITTAQKKGLAIQAFFLGDRTNDGFGKKDSHKIQFSLPAGWSEDIEIITPEAGFNPLTDL
jgi:hypothetical protein